MTPNNEPVAGGGSTELLVLVGTPSPATIIPTAIPPVDFDSPLSVSERAASFKSEPDIFDTSSVLSEVSTDTPDADDTMLYESNMAEPVAGTDNLTNQTPSDLDLISNTPTPTKTGPRSRKVRGKGSNILSGLTITMNDLPDKPRPAPPPPSSTPKPTAPPKYRASLHLSFFASDMDTSGTRVVRRGPGRPRKDALRRVDMMKVQVKEIKQQMQREYYEAARGSRLMYTVMSPQEKEIFGRALRYLQLPVYLNIRNGILRLWLQNPRVPLTLDQAMRVKRDHGYSAKYDHLLRAVYEFLVRYGYINFGYLSPIQTPTLPLSRLHLGLRNDPRQKTVVVVGAGMAGIACARQLHLLFAHFAPAFAPHPPPAIVVVEARGRIGGRVFSYPLHTQAPMQFECVLRAENKAVVFPRRPAGIDLGAQIITGFDGGNPMEVVVKKQLRLPLHPLMSNYCHLHDAKGERVSDETDRKCDEMFNEVLDLACGLKRDTRGWSEDLVEFLLTRGDARGEGVEKAAVPTVKREEVVEDWGLLEAGTPLSEAEGDRDTQDGSEVSSALSSPPPESVNGDAIGRDAIERAGVDAAETWRLKGMVDIDRERDCGRALALC
ncbi:hypothetical protein BC938DRAFT_473541 [Jimgerdemannia flammicorona]|uniref:SWIRM domain-containing protein n=1 Tax=Jimgerdemannia flammicorona TaxID=994334 RepID=A0A433Q480_9FUNG|nr:hypothetical protein BC938DRAFT_473541 [Jimgerdemannia flammicorona]